MEIAVKSENFDGMRIDVFIKENTDLSRNFISKNIEDGYIKVNGNTILKSSYKVKVNDIIDIDESVKKKELDVKPENLPLDIVYEDDDILIVNKERGIVVHPANGHRDGTLVNAIMYHCGKRLSSINGIIRPGIVHRIDKDTSGILCICKNDYSHNDISLQFMNHTNVRKYRLIVKGNIPKDFDTIETNIARDKKNRLRMAVSKEGKKAITKYRVLERFNEYTYIECELYTGRTHQIRVHMKSIGHPLLGDLLYGNVDKKFKNLDGQILHAYYLEITHPRTRERMKFESALPEYFENILKTLRK